ncbi:MAG: hypothetical protein ACTSQB_00170 [Candidatus Heimdallarchaeota archaeon]
MTATSATGQTVSCQDAQADVRNVRIRDECDPQVYSSSSTAGAEQNLAGVTRWSGTFDVYLDPALSNNIQFSVGDKVTFTGGGKTAEEVRIVDIETEWPIEGGGLLTATVSILGGAV